MSTLKGRFILTFLKEMPPLSSFDVCRMVQPYLARYHLTLNADGICFPEDMPNSQRMLLILYAPDSYRLGIPFQCIIFIKENETGIELFLRTGHVFMFWKDDILWDICNVYSYGEPSLLKLWRWIINGSMARCRKYIRHCFWKHT